MKCLKSSNKKIVLLIIIAIFLIPIITIHTLFKFPAIDPFFVAVWSAGEIITYFITFMSFLGTVSLGVLALVQNNRLSKINKDLTQHQFKPVITVTPFYGEIDEREALITYDREVKKDKEGNLINSGWSLHQPISSRKRTGTISIKNIGLGPAVNFEIYWYKLDSVEGLSKLDQIKEIHIENFYDKVRYSYFTYKDKEKMKNEPWMIFTEFDLGISEENNRINMLFLFDDSVGKMHTILEFRYKNILGRKVKKLSYLGYDSTTQTTSVMPVSKEYDCDD